MHKEKLTQNKCFQINYHITHQNKSTKNTSPTTTQPQKHNEPTKQNVLTTVNKTTNNGYSNKFLQKTKKLIWDHS
jgi:hypothetical protein